MSSPSRRDPTVAPSSTEPAAIGYCTTTSSVSPSATASTGCISSSSSTSQTSCCAASPISSDAAPRCKQPAQRRGIDGLRTGPQDPELELLAHLVEPVLELGDFGGQTLVVEQQCRVGEPHGGLGHVLHLDEHVDGSVEVADRRVLRHRGRDPRGRTRELAELVDPVARAAHDEHVVGEHEIVAVRVDEPVAAAAQRDDPHADVHRQVDVFEPPALELRAGPHAHAVRDLFGRGEVGDQRGRDSEAVRDDATDVDRGVAHTFDRGHDVQHARRSARRRAWSARPARTPRASRARAR